MELRHLRAFQAVARGASFTRAAAELHYAQSTITEQVQALEAELGVRLFERAGRQLALTSSGERLVAYADQVLSLVDEARDAVEESYEEPSGDLVVAGLETLCATLMPLILVTYRSSCPKVRITVKQGTRGELYEAVKSGTTDVCLTFGPSPQAAELHSEALRQERLVVVAPADHHLVGNGPLSVRHLRTEEFLVTEPGCGFREMYDRSLGRLGPDAPRVAAEVGSIAALGSCVAAGMGLALLPSLAVEARLSRGEVAILPIADADYQTPVTITWLRRWESKPSLAAWLATARETLGAVSTEDR